MPRYAEMSKAELEAELAEVRARYGEMAARGLKLNMARGKPSAAQLELSLPDSSAFQQWFPPLSRNCHPILDSPSSIGPTRRLK